MPKKKKSTVSVRKKAPSIRCVWGMLCTLSSVDQERNNISLFNVIEQFNLPTQFFTEQLERKEPLTVPHQYEIALLWRRVLDPKLSDDEIVKDIRIKTVDPSGKIIQELIVPLKFPPGKKSLRFRIGLPGITLTIPGDYVHVIETKSLNESEFEFAIEIPFFVSEVVDKAIVKLK